ncbi:hypothetical protein CALVIDRAFT_601828 [Calocera viscosa TUFC12733]|uniref:Uncharacterized protein n=1 Tax=Calocera viscosa (strain TUFC12733) TaxID=1330018 RepID=A0A167HUI0_CALVF|nr:hypothetical protein CALVIDRAFT_601828 [Calocera viscosa TUFC12733]
MWYSLVLPRWLAGQDGSETEKFKRIFEDTFQKKTTTDKGSLGPILVDPRYRELRQLCWIINHPTPDRLDECVTALAKQGLLVIAPKPSTPAPSAKPTTPRSPTPVAAPSAKPTTPRSPTPVAAPAPKPTLPANYPIPNQGRPARPSTPKLTTAERAKAIRGGGYATDAPAKPDRGGWQPFKRK